MKIMKLLALAGILSVCFAVGLYGGPLARTAYARIFPEPSYIKGNYDSVYAGTGHRIVLFSTSTCPYCKQARTLFAQNKIVYTDYLIDKSDDLSKKFKTLGGVAVPLIYIGNRKIIGFKESSINEAIASLHDQDTKKLAMN
ncbi:MAG: glutaredoxin family protein [Rhodanobacter sp.]